MSAIPPRGHGRGVAAVVRVRGAGIEPAAISVSGRSGFQAVAAHAREQPRARVPHGGVEPPRRASDTRVEIRSMGGVGTPRTNRTSATEVRSLGAGATSGGMAHAGGVEPASAPAGERARDGACAETRRGVEPQRPRFADGGCYPEHLVMTSSGPTGNRTRISSLRDWHLPVGRSARRPGRNRTFFRGFGGRVAPCARTYVHPCILGSRVRTRGVITGNRTRTCWATTSRAEATTP